MKLKRQASYRLAAIVLLVGGLVWIWSGDYRFGLTTLIVIIAIAMFAEEN